jgi:solute carrier family 25 (mitochondrial folate transporter), member 32
MTNPFWLIRVRMFATQANSPNAYRGLWGKYGYRGSSEKILLRKFALIDGLSTIVRTEGVQGLFRGTSLALVGVSTGAIQFMAYEKMKKWGFDRKKRQYQKAGLEWNTDADKLVRYLDCLWKATLVTPHLSRVCSPTSRIPSCRYQVK